MEVGDENRQHRSCSFYGQGHCRNLCVLHKGAWDGGCDLWRGQESAVLRITKDQSARGWSRHFSSGKTDLRFGGCLLFYFCGASRRHLSPEILRREVNRGAGGKKRRKGDDDVGL